jgi:hypothetical protein
MFIQYFFLYYCVGSSFVVLAVHFSFTRYIKDVLRGRVFYRTGLTVVRSMALTLVEMNTMILFNVTSCMFVKMSSEISVTCIKLHVIIFQKTDF